jgi:hypothetical protein
MARVKDLWAAYPERRGSRGKRWLAVWIDPTGRERSQAFGKKTEAERYASKMEIDVAQGGYIDPKKARITVAQWCETWLEGYGAHRPSTVRQARVHIHSAACVHRRYGHGLRGSGKKALKPPTFMRFIPGLRRL